MKMRSSARSIYWVVLIGLLGVHSAGYTNNQNHGPSPSESEVLSLDQNALKAKSIIVDIILSDPALRAGLSMERVEFALSGIQTDYYQSFSTRTPAGEEPILYQATMDIAGQRTAAHIRQTVGGGVVLDFSAITTPDVSYRLNNHAKWQYQDPTVGGIIKTFVYYAVPALVLKDALGRPGTLTYHGSSELDGLPAELIEFVDSNGLRARLWIQSETHTLRQFQYLAPAGIAGEQIIQYRYSGRQVVDTVAFPEQVEISIGVPNGQTNTLEMRVDSVNAEVDAQRFSPPADYTQIQERSFKAEYATDNIIIVRGVGNPLYQAVFVETDDGLIAFDALISRGLAARMSASAKALAGDKRITHVVLSHFHTDHIGGYAAYLDDNPVYIGTRDVAELLNTLTGRGPFLFAPPGVGPLPVSVESVDDALNIETGETTLRIIDIGPTPHVQQLLALYDPRSKLLITSDTYSAETAWSPSMTHFAQWLESTPVEIEHLIGVHHQLISREDLLQIADQQ